LGIRSRQGTAQGPFVLEEEEVFVNTLSLMSSSLDRNTIIDYYMGWAQLRARRHYRYSEYCLGLLGLLLVISPFCGRLVADP